MNTPSQHAQVLYRPRRFINHLLTYLLLLPTGIVVVVLLYLKCTFKSDTKQIAKQTHQRINEFYRRLRYDTILCRAEKKLTCNNNNNKLTFQTHN